MIRKYQYGGMSPETWKRVRNTSFTESMKEVSKAASDAYQSFSDSPYGLGYDILNAGLYAVAIPTGGATLPLAIGMSAAQGIAAANNAYNEGVNLNNGLDMAGAVISVPTSKAAKAIMKAVGKTDKYVKNASLFKNKGTGLVRRPSLFNLARRDNKYVPIFTYALAQPGINYAQIGNDVNDMKPFRNIRSYLDFSNYVNTIVDSNKQLLK